MVHERRTYSLGKLEGAQRERATMALNAEGSNAWTYPERGK